MDRRTFLGGVAMAALGGAAAEAAPPVEVRAEGEDIVVACGGRPFLRYRGRVVEPPPGSSPLLAASGYIHPVHAPTGAVVTDHLSPDHPHQRGVFSAWTKTQVTLDGQTLQPDFWNIHQGTGRVRSAGAAPLAGGGTGGHAGFRAEHVFEARQGEGWVPVLDDRWEVRFPPQPAGAPEAPGAAYIFDITSRQTPRVAVELPKYHYGGMAVRGARAWDPRSDLSVLTSEGKDRSGADGRRCRWIDMSGTVDGRPAGIALLEHPGNLRAPNAARMHPTMPYFVFALPQSGPLTLQPGKEYVFRYRVVAHNGRADRAALDRRWEQFAR